MLSEMCTHMVFLFRLRLPHFTRLKFIRYACILGLKNRAWPRCGLEEVFQSPPPPGATRLRCNLEKQTEENREYYEDLVLKPFTSNCINRIDMPPNMFELQDTRSVGSTQRYDELLHRSDCKGKLNFAKHVRICAVRFSK